MRRAITLAAILLGACGGGAVPVHLETDDEERAIESLDEAFAFWGVDYVLTEDDDRIGVVRMRLLDVEVTAEHELGDIIRMGSTTKTGRCRVALWSSYEPRILTHELGHAWLGPEHEPAAASWNLMSTTHMAGGTDDVTDEQWDDAQESIDRFLACRRD